MRWGLRSLLVRCRHDKTCVAGFEKRYHGVVSAFMFATETQQTIGKQPPVSLWHHCDDYGTSHPHITGSSDWFWKRKGEPSGFLALISCRLWWEAAGLLAQCYG